MRIRHSLKSLIPVILMLASAQTVQAQGGPPMPAAGMPMPGAQQVPGSYGMYPYQSPYQGMFEQTYQRDGTWFQNSVNGFGPNNRPRDWFVNLDYTRTHNRKMSGLVGADNVQTYLQQTFPATGSTAGGTAGGTGSAASFSNLKFYDAAAASIIPNLKTNGIKLSGGFWNPDGSGFLYSGGYQFENSATFDARERAMARRMNTADALPLNLGGRTDLDILKNDILAPGVVFDSVDAVDTGEPR